MRVEQALAALDVIQPLAPEPAAVGAALHRVLAAPAFAGCELPMFAQSAVDGYAVRHADLAGGALPVAGVVRAGVHATVPCLKPRTSQRIFTGGLLPEGADTVVRQEHVRRERDSIRILRAIKPGADVRLRGEELAQGAQLATAGTRVAPGLLAALAMAGVAEVSARPDPRIAVLVTGDEVVTPGTAPQLGQIHDANGPLVASWLAAQGYARVSLSYVADSESVVSDALAQAFAESDLVLTTGGVSVGDHDHVPHVARALGARTLFWKVAQKPGKPLFAALRETVPLLGLPGNPASVLVNLLVFVRRALNRLEGLAAPGPVLHTGVLDAPAKADAERDQWLRMALRFDERGCARLSRLPKQASHMLSNLAQAAALAWIPASRDETPADATVRWLVL